jgi:aryl-alcohol dehydrogenase
MKTVAAVVDTAGAPFELREVELDGPRAGEVLVRMAASAICHTDLTVRVGAVPFPFPGVLGHEGAGVVEAVGEGIAHVRAGDPVVLSFASCGACPTCVTGHPAMCKRSYPLRWGGARLDGSTTMTMPAPAGDGAAPVPVHGNFFGQSSFARHAVVAGRAVVPAPPDVPLEHLAPLGCGVQTGAGAVLNVLRPEPGSTLVVTGVGAVGLSAVMAAALSPAVRIIAVDVLPERLALARDLGATETVDARDVDLVAHLAELTGGLGADYVVETSGVVSVLQQAIRSVTSGGTVAVVGAPAMGAKLEIEVTAIISGARRIVGVVEGDSDPPRFIPALIALHRDGRFPLDRLIRTYPFADIETAAADAHAGRTIKPVLTFEEVQ